MTAGTSRNQILQRVADTADTSFFVSQYFNVILWCFGLSVPFISWMRSNCRLCTRISAQSSTTAWLSCISIRHRNLPSHGNTWKSPTSPSHLQPVVQAISFLASIWSEAMVSVFGSGLDQRCVPEHPSSTNLRSPPNPHASRYRPSLGLAPRNCSQVRPSSFNHQPLQSLQLICGDSPWIRLSQLDFPT